MVGGTRTIVPATPIPPDVLRQIGDLRRLTPWTRLKILALAGIWAAAAWVAVSVDSIWVQVPCWIAIALVLHGLGVFMHEGAHGQLFRRPWLDRSIGFLCGLPVMFPCSSYRATHLLHHQHENTPQDPDNLEANVRHAGVRALVYYAWFVVGMPIYILLVTVTGPFRARGWANRAACVGEPLLIGAFYAWLFSQAAADARLSHVLANGWALALPFAVVIANVRGLAEHTQLHHDSPPDPFRSTRSLESNRVVSFFFNNQNHHLEHHLFPGLPWNALGRVHALLKPVYEERGAAVTTGYGAWLADAVRYGPNRHLSYRNGRPTPDHLRER